jgi:hypothetical protein
MFKTVIVVLTLLGATAFAELPKFGQSGILCATGPFAQDAIKALNSKLNSNKVSIVVSAKTNYLGHELPGEGIIEVERPFDTSSSTMFGGASGIEVCVTITKH